MSFYPRDPRGIGTGRHDFSRNIRVATLQLNFVSGSKIDFDLSLDEDRNPRRLMLQKSDVCLVEFGQRLHLQSIPTKQYFGQIGQRKEELFSGDRPPEVLNGLNACVAQAF